LLQTEGIVILALPSSIFHPPSSILHPPSSILHPPSSILHPLSPSSSYSTRQRTRVLARPLPLLSWTLPPPVIVRSSVTYCEPMLETDPLPATLRLAAGA